LVLLAVELGEESPALDEPSDFSLGAAPDAESGVVSPEEATIGELRDIALVRKSV